MRNLFTSIFLLFIFAINIKAQELIQNGGFEEFDKLPVGSSNVNGYLKHWQNVNLGTQYVPNATPDFLHKLGMGDASIDINSYSLYGKIEPHSGAGVIYLNLFKQSELFSEYITQKFSSPLIVGNKYKLSFYATPGFSVVYNRLSINGLGIGLSVERLKQQKSENVKADFYLSSSMNIAIGSWEKIEFVFTADKPYQFLTIGYFLDGIPKIETISDLTYNGAGYFIDDVSLQVIEVFLPKKNPEKKVKQDEISKFEKRKLNISKEIKVVADTISFAIWDNELEDGDEVTLLFNEKPILEKYKLKTQKKYIQLKLEDDKSNILMMYAHNLGTVAPNTAALAVLNGEGKIYTLESNLKKSSGIKFIHNVKP